MANTTKKEFNRFSKREYEKKTTGEKMIAHSAAYFESDKKEERDGQFGKEFFYEGDFIKPDGNKTKIEIIISKSDRALGKVVIDGQEYVIWRNSNDRGSWNSFKMGDFYVTVKEGTDKNGNPYYVLTYSLPVEDEEEDVITEEIEF